MPEEAPLTLAGCSSSRAPPARLGLAVPKTGARLGYSERVKVGNRRICQKKLWYRYRKHNSSGKSRGRRDDARLQRELRQREVILRRAQQGTRAFLCNAKPRDNCSRPPRFRRRSNGGRSTIPSGSDAGCSGSTTPLLKASGAPARARRRSRPPQAWPHKRGRGS